MLKIFTKKQSFFPKTLAIYTQRYIIKVDKEIGQSPKEPRC